MNVEMLPNVKNEFPSLYTKRGILKKNEPKRFKCKCGHEFNKTKSVRFPGVTFGLPICEKCGGKPKESSSYSVWKRMINNQIEEEDFILNTVNHHPSITKEELEKLIQEKFSKKSNALGYLVYFSYLLVDSFKRDTFGVVEYTINPSKNLAKRYERIQ